MPYIMKTILIQEADVEILYILTIALELEGFKAVAVPSCEENILNVIAFEKPHALVLDHLLKAKECLAICKRVKRDYPSLPIIALSTNISFGEEYSSHGYDDFIPKPFDLDEVYTILKRNMITSA